MAKFKSAWATLIEDIHAEQARAKGPSRRRKVIGAFAMGVIALVGVYVMWMLLSQVEWTLFSQTSSPW